MDPPTHWLNTPAVGKSLEDVLACLSHTPVVGKSLGEAPICMLVAYTYSGQNDKRRSHTR